MLLCTASSAIPTTAVHGMVSARTRMHSPMASRPGHSVRAIDSLTTMTLGHHRDPPR
jgi:hypothetical protein